jgi:alpha-1,6-mannosyltransferase
MGRGKLVRIGGPSLPYDPTYHLLWRLDKVRAVVRRERPDVLEIHSPYAAAAAALSVPRGWYGVRTFQWHADFIDTYLRTMLERRVSPTSADVALAPLWAVVRGIASGCDATLVAARWQVDKLRAHGVPRVVHAPFGVERAVFSPDAKSDARRRELLGDGRERATLLVGVGRFAVEKRWDVAIDAFARVRKETDAVFVIFGDGPERAKMEAQARALGVEADVRMPGFTRAREALASALASADAMLHACPFETFGLSVAEALSAGLPVVVPSAGGAGELAHPSCSETFPPGDAGACARAVLTLLGRDRAALRSAAVRAAKAFPTVEDQLREMLAIYERLLAHPR